MCALRQQVLWVDNTMAEYLNTVDVKGYIDACFKQYPQARKACGAIIAGRTLYSIRSFYV